MGSKPGGAWKVYVISAEGGTPEAMIPGEGSEWNPSWEPSGNSLVFGEPRFAPNPTLHVLDLETRRISSLPGSQGLFSSQWSPDRRFIAALTKDSRRLLLFDLAAEKWKELVNSQLVSYPAWSRNGKYIYFCNPMGNVVRFYRVGVESLKVEDVASVNLPKGVGVRNVWLVDRPGSGRFPSLGSRHEHPRDLRPRFAAPLSYGHSQGGSLMPFGQDLKSSQPG